ncbi:tRNA-dihydrouridine(47) synthase [NAD(P)(+)]-like [Zingiber officinale]|uniref:tRNA-dihydrouridine(47) synthase [NAD(P)(+)]-like n=1 Tax=Zingiber officinale TaxID=94328 RepID=UPI001C4DA423|nr:tRNA-dihydrouridine(47) synthase [NAD(P)(+)]-like [Zingiber officinale]
MEPPLEMESAVGGESVGVSVFEGAACPGPEDLVARAIAPVKSQYLRAPPPRSGSLGSAVVDNANEKSSVPKVVVTKEKKSRRQLKRERKQEQESAKKICPEIAKTGNIGACRYNDNCRFSHDLDAYLAEKSPDLEGICPFINVDETCPYGITCRYSNTHKQCTSLKPNSSAKRSSEVNCLNKDLQKLLWKDKVSFPKADFQLQLLGLKVGKSKHMNSEADIVKDHQEADNKQVLCSSEFTQDCSPTYIENECLGSDFISEDPARLLKKPKSKYDEGNFESDISHGTNLEKEKIQDGQDCSLHNGQDSVSSDYLCSEVESLKPHARERKLIDFRGKLYLAPLTTVGNLPFRRICKGLGADITCGEMAMCTNLLQGQASEWALLRRHLSEDTFGVQICGAYPDTVARTIELIDRECTVDFFDINMGCPIDVVVNKGAGSALIMKPMRMKSIIQAAASTVLTPLTVKVRTGYFEGRNRIDSLVSDIGKWGACVLTIHGRSRQQRYSKLADWDYIYECARKAPDDLQILGNGDIFSYTDWIKHTSDCPPLASGMIGRAALIKPWIFTEIKEQRHWDITSGERFNILKDFVQFGLQHWGSDAKGVETTRHFLLEWLSYTCRYVPVGLLEIIPQRINWRPPSYYGRDDLETLMASDSAADWIRITEMLLGKVPEGFSFAPKHKSNAYDRAENG